MESLTWANGDLAPATPTGELGKDYSPAQVAFMRAVDDYKRKNHRPFPTWCEVLAVLHSLGYRKVEAATDLPRYRSAHCKGCHG